MKNKIIYISVFLGTFILTSGAIIYMNSKYSNIFKFDFRPAGSITSAADSLNNSKKNPADSLLTNSAMNDSAKIAAADSLRKPGDSLLTSLNKLKDSTNTAKMPDKKTAGDNTLQPDQKKELNVMKQTAPPEILKPDNALTENPGKKETVAENSIIPPVDLNPEDSLYIKWKKSTAKLYENMEPKKAAKIISSYSDNMARDIIYTMKKKKAADILAELNPEFASRITRIK